nr:hypothetical protein [Micromonospora sp. DSM 115978]
MRSPTWWWLSPRHRRLRQLPIDRVGSATAYPHRRGAYPGRDLPAWVTAVTGERHPVPSPGRPPSLLRRLRRLLNRSR